MTDNSISNRRHTVPLGGRANRSMRTGSKPKRPAASTFTNQSGLIRASWITTVLSAAMIFLSPAIGLGDVIWIRGQVDPIYGRIELETDQEVLIRVFENDRYGQKTNIPREQVEWLVVTIDAKRLAQLDPSNPASYRNYAEELAGQKSDPAAKDLATRLYLLAAATAENQLSGDTARNIGVQRSALLGLASLTESVAQRRRIDVLRHLIEPASDIGPLTTRDPASLPQSETKKQLMLELVHAIRREQTDRALQLLNSLENRKVFEGWREWCGVDELEQMARANRPSQVQLSKLLAIELQIDRDASSTKIPTRQNRNWGDYAVQVSNTQGVLPTFENITRFDPRKSVYRSGTWVVPVSN